jgi:DNA-binding Xre family transcriptional regulator
MAEMELNRGDLAERAGITEMTLRLIMRGGDCKLTTLASIARVLGINADELLVVNGTGQPAMEPA